MMQMLVKLAAPFSGAGQVSSDEFSLVTDHEKTIRPLENVEMSAPREQEYGEESKKAPRPEDAVKGRSGAALFDASSLS